MKRSSKSVSQGIVQSSISLYTYLDAAYRGLNRFLHRQSRLFNTRQPQAPPVPKHPGRAKKHEVKTGAPVSVSGTHRNPSAVMHRRTA